MNVFAAMLGVVFAAEAFAQAPIAPPVPACAMQDGRSNCRFKPVMTGTPTSVSGNRVILFRYSKSGGHGTSRIYLDSAVMRLSARYSFTATITEDPAIFTDSTLANTKVVIMSNGDGDVVAPGRYRAALEDFNQVKGWGVIWIHAACAFITSGWHFGQQSCVQQYLHTDPSGTERRLFLDSGTAESPNHGIRNPQSEFLLRNLPGWNGSRTLAMQEEFYCFRTPARNTPDVNVLLGYDRSSGLHQGASCADAQNRTETGSQNHNLAWTHMMGNGISIFNSLGHDAATYTQASHMGDSLLWRLIRYAAKDWENPGVSGITVDNRKRSGNAFAFGSLAIDFAEPGPNAVIVSDIRGKRIFAGTYAGGTRAEIPGLRRGIYYVRVSSRGGQEVRKVGIL